MKFSEQWLREWINPPISTQELVQQLISAGLEVDSVNPVAGSFSNVVVGQVVDVIPHPDADRLRVCQVDVGTADLLNIVCGAQNVRKDLKVAVAMINAVLPGDFKIKKSKIRGVESSGMLCSESELGLADTSSGIMELPNDAPIGQNVRDYLNLDDSVIDVELTPNRGDCLSILGVAREIAAINKLPLQRSANIADSISTIKNTIPIKISAPQACIHYMGRVIKNINTNAKTPLWMQEKLRRSDIRPISLVVDITNYVLLELGQPLHAFDLNQIRQGIDVRFAQGNEVIDLLDDQQLRLQSDDLVITSDNNPIALAGIMGGRDSGITSQTNDIFLESALFFPTTIARTSRKFGLYTDSSHRFERGVDYQLQRQGLELASKLILEMAGGEIGEIIEVGQPFKEKPAIFLRHQRISRILGIEISEIEISNILERLQMKISDADKGWQVIPPSYRNDLNHEIDLIEEIARIYGYDKIPPKSLQTDLNFLPISETKLNISRLKNILVDSGYQEAITYSFVDPVYEKKLALQPNPLTLLNPIASNLSTMRTNHWPGLIKAYQYNYHRQQPRVRLFEIGLCFQNNLPQNLVQNLRLGGICSGLLYEEQWGETKRNVDFFDIKTDIENILAPTGIASKIKFEPYDHPALHPGKSAAILYEQRMIGCLGAIHPNLAQEFDINQPLYLFDLDLESIMEITLPTYEAVSKFPAVRRDVALVVENSVPAKKIKDKILASGGELLKNVNIFDIYQGKGIETGKKSIALSLIFQHVSRTLVDAEINDFMQQIVQLMHKEFNATLRD